MNSFRLKEKSNLLPRPAIEPATRPQSNGTPAPARAAVTAACKSRRFLWRRDFARALPRAFLKKRIVDKAIIVQKQQDVAAGGFDSEVSRPIDANFS